MLDKAPALALLGYLALLATLALAGVFTGREDRREAAIKILRLMLPWAFVWLLIETRIYQHDPSRLWPLIAGNGLDPANGPGADLNADGEPASSQAQ